MKLKHFSFRAETVGRDLRARRPNRESGAARLEHMQRPFSVIHRCLINISRLIAAFILLLAPTGCTLVKPWQRGTLADYSMRSDRDPLADMQKEHVWFSREESNGGEGVGGGGCGCN